MPRPAKGYQFTVEGTHDFPFDMLRYDRCWPARESEDSILIAPGPRSSIFKEKRQITLVGLQTPTEGRWASFGWRVFNVNKREINVG